LESTPQRFVFVFTPTHGSWLNRIENQFCKMARTMLRGVRVAGKQELIDRIHQYFEEINADPVVFRWKYSGGPTSASPTCRYSEGRGGRRHQR
jgi:hypothetical protein